MSIHGKKQSKHSSLFPHCDIHINTSQFTATRKQKGGGTQNFKTETARTNFNQPAFV